MLNYPGQRQLKMISKTSMAFLVLSSVLTPLTAVAATTARPNVHTAHIAVDGQVLRNPKGYLMMADPATKQQIAFMPVWYAFYLLKPYGLSYAWDAKTDSLHITASGINSISVPSVVTDKDGHLKVYVNGQLVQTMMQYVATDPASQKQTLYVPVWYMNQVLSHMNVHGSWDGQHQLWNLAFGANSQGVIQPMVMTITNSIAHSPFVVTVAPMGLDGKPTGPGHTVKVTDSDGQTAKAVWNAQTQAYEALFDVSRTSNLSFRTTVDDVPIPSAAKTLVNPQGGTPTPGQSIVKAVTNSDGSIIVSIDPKDKYGKRTGAGQNITVTASNGEQKTATWNPAKQVYQVTVPPQEGGSNGSGSNGSGSNGSGSNGSGSNGSGPTPLTFTVFIHHIGSGNHGTTSVLAKDVKTTNGTSSGTSTGGTSGTAGSGESVYGAIYGATVTANGQTLTVPATDTNIHWNVPAWGNSKSVTQSIYPSVHGAVYDVYEANPSAFGNTLSYKGISMNLTLQAFNANGTPNATSLGIAQVYFTPGKGSTGTLNYQGHSISTNAASPTIVDLNQGSATLSYMYTEGTNDTLTIIMNGVTNTVLLSGSIISHVKWDVNNSATTAVNTQVTLQGQVLDSNNAPVTNTQFTVSGSDGLSQSITTDGNGNFSFNDTPSAAGTVTYTVSGGKMLNGQSTIMQVVNQPSTSTTLGITVGNPGVSGNTVTYNPTAQVLDQFNNVMSGQTLIWSIQGATPAGVIINHTTGQITIDDTKETSGSFTIQATNGTVSNTAIVNYAKPAANTLNVTVGNAAVNVAGMTTSYAQSVTVLDQYGHVMNGQTVTWSIQGGVPAGVMIGSTTGAIRIDVNTYTGTGFTVIATDGAVFGTASLSYTQPPIPTTINIVLGSSTRGTSTLTYHPIVQVLDQYNQVMNGQTIAWSIVGAPITGLNIDSATGQLTIDETQANSGSFIIQATDGAAFNTAIVNYTQPTAATVDVTLGSASVDAAGTTTSYVPSATVRDQYGHFMSGERITWSIQGGASGVMIDSTTGAIRIDANTYTGTGFTVLASDGAATGMAYLPYAKPASTPSTVSISLGSATFGTSTMTYAPTAQVFDQYNHVMSGQPLTWSIQGTVPRGVSIDSATGQLTIDETQANSGSFVIQATDGSAFAATTVNYAQPAATSMHLTLGSASVNAAGTTTSYAPSVTVLDQYGNAMSGQAVTWSIQGGAPAGVMIDSTTGAIRIDAHTYAGAGFTVMATDGAMTKTASISYSKPAPVPTTFSMLLGDAHQGNGLTIIYNPTVQVRDQYNNLMTGQKFTWSIVDAPIVGLSIDSATGQVTRYPSYPNNFLELRVTDGTVSYTKLLMIRE